jgi:hypothetical protein
MKNTFRFVLKHYLFFFGIFIFFRVLFLLSLLPFPEEIEVKQILISVFAGFKTDLSTASYLAVIPFLLLAINLAGAYQTIEKILRVYYLFLHKRFIEVVAYLDPQVVLRLVVSKQHELINTHKSLDFCKIEPASFD